MSRGCSSGAAERHGGPRRGPTYRSQLGPACWRTRTLGEVVDRKPAWRTEGAMRHAHARTRFSRQHMKTKEMPKRAGRGVTLRTRWGTTFASQSDRVLLRKWLRASQSRTHPASLALHNSSRSIKNTQKHHESLRTELINGHGVANDRVCDGAIAMVVPKRHTLPRDTLPQHCTPDLIR